MLRRTRASTGRRTVVAGSAGRTPRRARVRGETNGVSTPLKVLMLSAEVAPYAKVGGLADVAGSLPLALAATGHDVVTIMPRYGAINPARYDLHPPQWGTPVTLGTLGTTTRGFGFYEGRMGAVAPGVPRPRILFADNGDLFGEPQVYGLPDEHERWFFFCRAALQWCTTTRWRPDVVHCHDWHTALAVHLLRYTLRWDRFWDGVRTVFTIHNLAYQGLFDDDRLFAMADINRALLMPVERANGGSANPMARGIAEADAVTTVSPTYRDEIVTPAYGEGLESLLAGRDDRLFGILNGIDMRVWDPARDMSLAATYSADQPEGKAANKAALQRAAGLDVEPNAPLIGVVARLVEQKGFDLVAPIGRDLVRSGAQLVVLGTGDAAIEGAFRALATEFPTRVAAYLAFDGALSERIYAGSDIFLMPSRFEPCGLGQMIAMRYGTIPVVRRTGGLADTVTEYDPKTESGTGFLFSAYDPAECLGALLRAMGVFRDGKRWASLMGRAMRRDASWEASAREYERVYLLTGAGRR